MAGLKFFLSLLIAFCGGVFGSLSFPNEFFTHWSFIFPGIFAFVMAFLRVQNTKRPFAATLLVAFLWAAPFHTLQIYWLSYPANSIVPWIALSLVEIFITVFWSGIWFIGYRFLHDWKPNNIFIHASWFALSFSVLEILRSNVPFGGFPWSLVGFSQVNGPLIAWAPWGGTFLLAFICSGISYLFYICFSIGILKKNYKLIIQVTGITLVTILLPQFSFTPINSKETITVTAVQGNVPGRNSYNAFGEPLTVANNHLRLTINSKKQSDLIIWPENALDLDPEKSEEAKSILEKAYSATKVPIISGVIRRGYLNNNSIENTMVLWENNRSTEVYTKNELVAFGEYLPLRNLFTAIYPPSATLIAKDITPGTGPAVLHPYIKRLERKVSVGVPICFEVARQSSVREAVANGAQVLLFPTSNTFFGPTPQAFQQLQMAQFRAAEFKRDAIQVSTMSASAAIDARGHITSPTIGLYKSGVINKELHLSTQKTLSLLLGPWLEYAGLLGWIIVTVLALGHYKRRHKCLKL